MDKTVLVNDDIKAGEALTIILDEAGIPFNAALWMVDPSAEDWRFVIGTELVETKGLDKAYKRILPLLERVGVAEDATATGLSFMNVKVVASRHRLIKEFVKTLRVDPHSNAPPKRIRGRFIGDTFVEDAYVYRLHPPRRKTRKVA